MHHEYLINLNNREIARLVYELYGLTNAEVKIIDPEALVTGNDNDLFKAKEI